MTYPELQSRIVQWAGKPAVSQAVATCITLVEADLNRRLAEAGVAGAQKAATATLSAGESRSAAPGDMARAIRMIRVADGGIVDNVTEPSLAALKAAAPDRVGAPLYYSLVGAECRYYPSPDASHEVELTYQAGLAALSDDNASNWLLAAWPDVYLYGGLARVGGFLGDAEMEARWTAQYERAVAGLIEAERDRCGDQRVAAFRAELPSALCTTECEP